MGRLHRRQVADPAFRARIEDYRRMIADDEAKLARGHEEIRALSRDWLLLRLKRIHAMAMAEEHVGIGADGAEVYLPRPDFAAAIRSLSRRDSRARSSTLA